LEHSLHKRFLDRNSSDRRDTLKHDLLEALRCSEGRMPVAETIGAVQPIPA